MKISYNWLKDYIHTDLGVEQIAKILTDIGIEVEGIEKIESIKGALEGLVVGEVLTCEKHPDADKLSVTTIDYGDGIKTIVCGAENVAVSQKVIVATIGTTLYPIDSQEGFKIKKSKIRGVESCGMLCAEDEIGVGTSHDGIIVLDNSVKIGTPAKEVFNIKDEYILEVGLTPNRIDAASHYGVARDLAAYLKSHNLKGELSKPSVADFAIDSKQNKIEVKVLAPEKAPHYMGIIVSGLKIAPSPQWLQEKLRAIGLNPKNNVVDITNFILHEIGQPLHAFDADKISGGKIIVRNAVEGEKFTTLDSVERVLSSEDLVICDDHEPLCIAGVMGGANSGVSSRTTKIFIESAYFNPVSVRKTAKRHSLSSDASFRYERGTDPNVLTYALKRAAILMKTLASGEITSDIISIKNSDFEPFTVELSIEKTEKVIGKKIGKETIIKILEALEIKVIAFNAQKLTLAVPPYRVDVRRDIDVIEEILRIYGMNNIEIPQSVHSTLSYAPIPDKDRIANRISEFLSSNGFNEIMSNSLTKSSYYEQCSTYPLERCVRIANPLSIDLNVMRQTLLFNALEAVQLNVNRRNQNLKLYEFGNCYQYVESKKEQGGLSPYLENNCLSLLMTGLESSASWNSPVVESSFYSIKAISERLLTSFGLNMNEAQYNVVENDLYWDAVSVKIKGRLVMTLGVVAKKWNKLFDLKATVFYAEIQFDTFVDVIKSYSLTVSELPKYPEVRRDLALLVDQNVTFSQLYSVAFKTEKELLKSVTLFDVYQGDKLPEGKKSYALNFVLEDTTKTLTDNVIDKCMNSLVFQFEKQLNAKIRN